MASNQVIRVVIADDHFGVRSALRGFLERTGNILVVGEAGNGMEAVEKVETLDPDLLILDLEMPVMGGIEALAALQRKGCNLPVLILSANDKNDFATGLIDLGASGYLMKEEAPSMVISMVRKIALSSQSTYIDTSAIKNAS